jgi:hypothetical protein
MDNQLVHAARRHGHAERTYSMDKQVVHAGWSYMEHGYSMGMQHGDINMHH